MSAPLLRRITPAFLFTVLAFALTCDSQNDEQTAPGGLVDRHEPELLQPACADRGELGGSGHCSAACLCGDSEGHCESDDECAPGLTCRSNIGAHFGWAADVGVCVAPCSPIGVPVEDMCSAACPCPHGVGDCDDDADCQAGARCIADAGAAYGFDPDIDVCEIVTCGTDDTLEPNDAAASARLLTLDQAYSDTAYVHALTPFLCSGNEDWYLIPTSSLTFTVGFIDVHLLARDAGLCGASCDQVELPDAPENTVTVEFYDVTGGNLLGTVTSTKGRIHYHRWSDVSGFNGDFLMRVTGPPEAGFEYELEMRIQTDSFEDECEC